MCNYNEQKNDIITSNIDSNLFNSFEEELQLSICEHDFSISDVECIHFNLQLIMFLKATTIHLFKNIRQLHYWWKLSKVI